MKTTRIARVTLTAVASALSLLLTSCGSPATEVCDVICTCVSCNDRERDLCLVNEQQELDRSLAYACDEEYSDYLDCIIINAMCVDGEFAYSADCQDLVQDYGECITDASDRFGS